MSEFHEIDWQKASVQDRIAPNKALFRLMVQLSKKLDVHFDVLLEEAQEKPVTTAGDPHRNFRRGEIAKERSHKIHEWIGRNHFEWAQEQEPELFQVPRKSDWDQFLEKHAVEDGIRIVTENASEADSLNVVRFADDTDDEVLRLRLGQKFFFDIDVPFNGVAVAFQKAGRNWYPFALFKEESRERARVVVRKGVRSLPRNGTGEAVYLSELDDTGPSEFVFVLSTDSALPASPGSIAQFETDEEFLVLRHPVHFIT